MSKQSIQKRLQKIRPPRVQLTYDVEKGDAIEQKELPFVVGVLGDFGRDPEAPLPKLKDRSFVGIDMDNFDEVIRSMEPCLSFRAANKLSADGGELGIRLRFRCIDDFRPEAVVQQIEPLRKLLEVRSRLADLRNKLSGNERLEDLLQEALSNPEQLKALSGPDQQES